MINFAIVGCGRIAKRHSELLGLEQIAGARLAAVCDIVLEKAKEFGERFGVPYYQSFDEMMQNEQIDVASVLTPSGMHAEHVIALARYKRHIVVEKPMALTLTDAEAMIKACDANGVRLFVVAMRLWLLAATGRAAAVLKWRGRRPLPTPARAQQSLPAPFRHHPAQHKSCGAGQRGQSALQRAGQHDSGPDG